MGIKHKMETRSHSNDDLGEIVNFIKDSDVTEMVERLRALRMQYINLINDCNEKEQKRIQQQAAEIEKLVEARERYEKLCQDLCQKKT